MEANPARYCRAKPEPPAPVSGGMRWRRPYHDIIELCRRDRGLTTYDPDEPPEPEPSPPEPGGVHAPLIVSTPPGEARAGSEYAYQARAYAGHVDGFTWCLESEIPGMTVDRYTGRVTWTPSEGGYVEVVLCARSVYGAESRQCWTLCVRRARVRRFAANPRFRDALRRKRLRSACLVRRVRRSPHRERERAVARFVPPAPPGGRFPVAAPLRM